MVRRGRKIRCLAAAILLTAVIAGLLLFPFSEQIGLARASYECFWEDGTQTTERYADVCAAVTEVLEEKVLLERNGVQGVLSVSGEYIQAYRTLRDGSLAELLALSLSVLCGAERFALGIAFGKTVFYGEEPFALDGTRVVRSDRSSAETVVLLFGELPEGYLAETGAERLVLRPEALFSADALEGSGIRSIEAEAPYSFERGAVYLDTAGGKRLVAALPELTFLEIGQVDFCDEGALASCMQLCSLVLPFVGNTRYAEGKEYVGRLSWLFGGEGAGESVLPPSLKAVRVTGGAIGPFAFYGCGGLEEIDLCGTDPASVARDALIWCDSLRMLHAPRDDLMLTGNFSCSPLDCGCALYQRTD